MKRNNLGTMEGESQTSSEFHEIHTIQDDDDQISRVPKLNRQLKNESDDEVEIILNHETSKIIQNAW